MTRKGPLCGVCAHREAAAIDLALVGGVSMEALGRRYGLSHDQLYRHRKNHLTPAMKAKLLAGPALEGVDLEALRETEGQSWLAHMLAIRQRLFAALALAEEHGDVNQIVRVANAVHSNMETVGRHLGELSTGSHTTNILISPQYVHLRMALVRALTPYPDAARAVAAVLHSLESEAAEVINQPRTLAR